MNGCPFLVEDCTMDGTDYECEHPTYGTKYGCDRCPMFGRNGSKRQYRLVNPRERLLTKHAPDVLNSGHCEHVPDGQYCPYCKEA